MAELELAVYNKLISVSALTTLLGDTTTGVWQVLASPTATKPYLVIRTFDESPNDVMSTATTPTEAAVQISSYSDTFEDAVKVTTQLKAALNRWAATQSGTVVQATFYDGFNDRFDPVDEVYQRDHDFRFFYEE